MMSNRRKKRGGGDRKDLSARYYIFIMAFAPQEL
jgi:hypothetical protein